MRRDELMHRHPQDDLIIVEALTWMARQYAEGSKMWYHCWAMADEIAHAHGLTLVDAIKQREPLERQSQRRQ